MHEKIVKIRLHILHDIDFKLISHQNMKLQTETFQGIFSTIIIIRHKFNVNL